LPRFEEVAERYPKSGLVDKSLYMMTISNIRLGRIEDAKEAFSKLSVDFPASRWTKKAEKKMRHAAK